MQDEIVVAVCTFQRTHSLLRTLRSLAASAREADMVVSVVIVDNNLSGEAKAFASEQGFSAANLAMTWIHEPRKGLVSARNAALNHARAESRSIAFIDDDETVSPGWLRGLHESVGLFPDCIVVGPVVAVPESNFPSWDPNGKLWQRETLEDQQEVSHLPGDGNIFYPKSLVGSGMSYDSRFNVTGGQDTDFLIRARKLGYRMVWAEEMKALEWVQEERLKEKWLVRRNFFSAMAYAWVEEKHGQSRTRLVMRVFKHVLLALLSLLSVASGRAKYKTIKALNHLAIAYGSIKSRTLKEYDRY